MARYAAPSAGVFTSLATDVRRFVLIHTDSQRHFLLEGLAWFSCPSWTCLALISCAPIVSFTRPSSRRTPSTYCVQALVPYLYKQSHRYSRVRLLCRVFATITHQLSLRVFPAFLYRDIYHHHLRPRHNSTCQRHLWVGRQRHLFCAE
jgi:hypothetical protein